MWLSGMDSSEIGNAPSARFFVALAKTDPAARWNGISGVIVECELVGGVPLIFTDTSRISGFVVECKRPGNTTQPPRTLGHRALSNGKIEF